MQARGGASISDKVAIHWGTPRQTDLDSLDVRTAERYAAEGHFGAGSMLPKVQAAIDFVRSGRDRQAVISSLEMAPQAMSGHAGTTVSA